MMPTIQLTVPPSEPAGRSLLASVLRITGDGIADLGHMEAKLVRTSSDRAKRDPSGFGEAQYGMARKLTRIAAIVSLTSFGGCRRRSCGDDEDVPVLAFAFTARRQARWWGGIIPGC
jgi:hypothetical protein